MPGRAILLGRTREDHEAAEMEAVLRGEETTTTTIHRHHTTHNLLDLRNQPHQVREVLREPSKKVGGPASGPEQQLELQQDMQPAGQVQREHNLRHHKLVEGGLVVDKQLLDQTQAEGGSVVAMPPLDLRDNLDHLLRPSVSVQVLVIPTRDTKVQDLAVRVEDDVGMEVVIDRYAVCSS
jgi:hypothetical protein